VGKLRNWSLAMLFTRFDGTLAQDVPAYRRIIPFLMKGRNESAVYFEQTVDLTHTLPWIERFNATHNRRISLLYVVLGALVRTLGERPRLNRFISGRRLWDRKEIWLSFAAKQRMDDRAPLRTVKMRFDPAETFANLAVRLGDAIGQARSGRKSSVDRELGLLLRLPRLLLELVVRVARLLDFFNLAPRALFEHDPMYTSAFVANLGSLKLDAAYHHLFEHGNCPLFLTVGCTRREPVVADDGTVQPRTVVRLKYVYDERIEDGLYCARALDLLRQRVEDPAAWAEDTAVVSDAEQHARRPQPSRQTVCASAVLRRPRSAARQH
jgi:hypothetical protein